MKKKTELALKQLYDKYTMLHLTLFCLTEKRDGKWLKRKGKDGTIYINELEDVKIIEDNNGILRAVQISNDYSCPIDDEKIIDIINEIRPKPKKVAKKSKKKKAQPKKKDYNGVTYMDVFKRVVDIMHNKTGYAPYAGDIEDEENGEVNIDLDEGEHKVWQNVRTFLGGWTEEDDDGYETQSIFDLVDDLDMRYEKLASRWDAQFCDSCRILGTVYVEDNTPAGIMEALDKAGL